MHHSIPSSTIPYFITCFILHLSMSILYRYMLCFIFTVPNDFVSVHCDNLIERKDTITGITFYFDGVTVPCYCLLEPTNREIYPHWQINLKYYNSRDEKWYDWQTLRPSMWKDWRLGVPEFSVRPQGKSAAQFVIYRNGLEMLTQNHVVLYPSGSPRPNGITLYFYIIYLNRIFWLKT